MFKITREGSYYLTADVLGAAGKSGIEITTSGVALDLMGFAMRGISDSEDGIRVSVEATTVAVRDGTVLGWGRNGLDLATASDGRYRDIVTSGNRANGLICGARSTVVDCFAQSNGEQGVKAGDGSTVRACSAHDNSFGIVVGQDSVVSESLGRGNSVYGISADRGSNVSGCSASANGLGGISAQDGSTVVDCTASFNSDVGIFPGTGSTLSGCTASGNRGDGIRPGEGTIVTGCTLRENGGSGIQVSSRNRIVGNACDSNGAAGIRALNSDNLIEGNSVTGNDRGLEVRGTANTVRNNTVRNNRINYDIVQGNLLNILLSQIPESIDWPASVALAGSLTGIAGSNGITVNSSDVTLDLAGHALLGVPGSLDGIEVTREESLQSRTNFAVKNGTVRGWGKAGVNGGNASNALYQELRLSSNGDGPFDHGLDCGSNSVVIGCTAMSNSGDGIRGGAVITDCVAQDNGVNGINAGNGTIRGCAADGNEGNGINGSGIIRGCGAFGNNGDGISGGRGSTVRECTASGNGGRGISTDDHCYVVQNNCSENGGAGIGTGRVGQFSRIESNQVSGNTIGISVETQLNLIIRNSAFDNHAPDGGSHNYDIVGGNFEGPSVRSDIDTDSNPHANYDI